MLSYIEIKPIQGLFEDDDMQYQYGASTLIPEIKKKWSFSESTLSKDGKFCINNELHFLLSIIKDKSHIWSCLQFMLGLSTNEKN